MTKSEKNEALRSSRTIPKVLAYLAFLVAGVGFAAPTWAADFGNTAANENLAAAISQTEGANTNNSSRGLFQAFTLTQTIEPLTLTLYAAAHNSPSDSLIVELCAYPQINEAKPCSEGGATYITSWTISEADLAQDTAGQDTWAELLEVPDGITLYNAVPYGLEITRTTENSSTNNYRLGYTIGDYTGGEARWRPGFGGSTECQFPRWIYLTGTTADCANSTGSTYDFRFFFSTTSADLTLDIEAIGGAIHSSGFCIEPEDLPEGWVLFSNAVEIEYRHDAATGTWILETLDCANGVYNNSPTFKKVWNGEWEVIAHQRGSPTSFEASATTTVFVEGNPTQNPVDLLGLEMCGSFSLLDVLDENAWPCYARAFIRNVLTFPPFSWYEQVRTAILTDSATDTHSVTLTVPASGGFTGTSIPLFTTNATSGGIVGALNDAGTIGGNTWYEWLELIFWLGFIGYAIWRMTTIFEEI